MNTNSGSLSTTKCHTEGSGLRERVLGTYLPREQSPGDPCLHLLAGWLALDVEEASKLQAVSWGVKQTMHLSLWADM